MRGHLEERGKDRWRAKVYLGAGPNGTKRYLTRTIRGPKRHAENVLAQLIVEAGAGGHDVTDGTVEELARRWIEATGPGLSPTTLRGYEYLLRTAILPRIGHMKLRALRPQTLDQLYGELLQRGGKDGKPLSPRSVHHVHALVRRILNQGVRWGWTPSNPALRATPPRVPHREMATPEPDELRRLIVEAERVDEDLATFVRLAAVTGARRGELCGLRWSDVDLAHGSLSITRSVIGMRNDALIVKDTKTHAGRRIALDPETVDSLARQRQRHEARALVAEVQLADGAYIFTTTIDGSRPRRPDGMSLAFIRLRRRAGVKELPLHSLRHFAATRMLAAGVPVRTVSGRLGHANAATTLNVYSHWVAAADQEAASTLGALLSSERASETAAPEDPLTRRSTRYSGSPR